MFVESTTLLLVAFYMFCAALIGLFIFEYRLINHPKFRQGSGDITTEVGYEEDPTGEPVLPPLHGLPLAGDSETHSPHIQAGAHIGTGPM